MPEPRILIVEDSELLLNLECLLMKSEGFDVRGAPDAGSALACVAEWDPDLVLLDINLPDRDGFEVCREIKKRDPAISVIMLTARRSRADVAQAAEAGADRHIGKPFSSTLLLKTVRSLLAEPSRHRKSGLTATA